MIVTMMIIMPVTIVIAVAMAVMMIVVAAIDIGITPQVLEEGRTEKPCDQGAKQRKEDDGLIHVRSVSPS